MEIPDYDDPRWRTPTRSNQEGGDCVRALVSKKGTFVADSKLREKSPVIRFSSEAWTGLITKVTGAQV